VGRQQLLIGLGFPAADWPNEGSCLLNNGYAHRQCRGSANPGDLFLDCSNAAPGQSDLDLPRPLPAMQNPRRSLKLMEAPPTPVVSRRRDDNARRATVISCVIGALDANRPDWNSDGHGDSRAMDRDLHYDVHSVPAFLGVVSRCLAPTFTLTIDSTLVQACVSATVANLKFLVFQNTK
jgi:hypothetical protein